MTIAAYRGKAALLALLVAVGPVWGKTTAEKQEEIRTSSRQILDELYTLNPEARKAVEGAAGYAVFSNFGMKLGLAGGGSGKGMAVDNATHAVTFMKMVEIQAGFGLGAKTFKLVWVFESPALLKQFVDSGWELGGQSTAAAQAGKKGKSIAGAICISQGVWLYQMVGTGLALEMTAKGTKYYKDKKIELDSGAVLRYGCRASAAHR